MIYIYIHDMLCVVCLKEWGIPVLGGNLALDLGVPNLDTTPFALSPCACLICKACDLLSRTSS